MIILKFYTCVRDNLREYDSQLKLMTPDHFVGWFFHNIFCRPCFI